MAARGRHGEVGAQHDAAHRVLRHSTGEPRSRASAAKRRNMACSLWVSLVFIEPLSVMAFPDTRERESRSMS